MKTIVIAYDDTEPALLALRAAAELTEALNARLIVVTVVTLDDASDLGDSATDFSGLSREQLEPLERAKAFLAAKRIDATYQPAIGDPADSIVELAEMNDADLIVVGTRDPGAIQRLFGYSVSQGVLRRTHCNVLVVRR
jgi:nucleotide-binding universal stress UspA family protein